MSSSPSLLLVGAVFEAPALPGKVVPREWSPLEVAELLPEIGSEPEELEPEAPEVVSARVAAAERLAAEEAERRAREEERRREVEEWEARVREAYERGYAQGRQEGEKAEEARLRGALRAAEDALDELREGEIRWTGTIEENVCALAVVVARQVIGRELADDVGPVMELVRAALDEFPVDQPMRIRVNPTDHSAIMGLATKGSDPMKKLTQDRDARWLPDPSIAPGGCVVEGRDRIIDGRVDVALERIYRRLTYTNA